jgi:hypothetical protein
MNGTPPGLAEALDDARKFTAEILYASDPMLDTLVLAAAISHNIDLFNTVPRLLFTSDEPKCGKGHPHGTGILTPTGYVPVETLMPGDTVVGSDGQPVKVTDIYRRGVLPVYRVMFNDGTSVRVDGDHLWATRDKNAALARADYRVLSTRDLAATNLPSRNWEIPLPAPAEMTHQDLPIDPYILGVLLGDGHFGNRAGILLSSDEAVLAEVSQRLPEGYRLRPSRPLTAITRGRAAGNAPSPFMDTIRLLGLMGKKSYDKFIPDIYLHASREQRLELLRGLMDTDGILHRATNGGTVVTRFSSASETLTDQVRFLVQSLGGVARKRIERGATYILKENSKRDQPEKRKGRLAYQLHISMFISPFLTRPGWEPLRRPPKHIIKSIEPDGEAEVTCIRVDAADSLYLTEHCIVTHNTTALDLMYMLGFNAWMSDATSYALRARFNEPARTTFILDELGKIFGASGLRGQSNPLYKILVEGYRRTATLSLSVDRTATDVSSYSMAACAGLRTAAPADLRSRCIIFAMKPIPDSLPDMRSSIDSDTEAEGAIHRGQLHQAVMANTEAISLAYRSMRPPHRKLKGRLGQIWKPLFALAHAAGGDWPAKVLAAFKTLGLDTSDQPVLSPVQMVLRDTAAIFRASGEARMFAADIAERLREVPDVELYRTLTDRRLAQLMTLALGETTSMTIGEHRARGFYAREVLPAWEKLDAELSAADSEEYEPDKYDTMFDVTEAEVA